MYTILHPKSRRSLTAFSSVHGSTSAAVETDPAENGDHSSNYTNSTTFENAANVVAVFVSRFDVHRGNIIEWQYPDGESTATWR